ncbi:phosphoribosyl-AMP cyclohydrolase [Gilvimarinus agarilyticus]|uniref:phosphoribosyl-AMP cyclohydrolase n=1 Tax=Gilvimarinus agarilyticus TaxID=679259 RepID=UPI0005A18510|nr:phosphoribosyl-AMP cyclohydrolase [Gilvimarinus agarilyticus]
MKRDFFVNLENHDKNKPLPLAELTEELAFNRDGLIPVITQDASSGTVLMFAWMNKDALASTLKTGRVTYWSRSRQKLWVKGETSGHTQHLVSMSFDCDGDAVLCQIEQNGAACHTGRRSCFYLEAEQKTQRVWVTGYSATPTLISPDSTD